MGLNGLKIGNTYILRSQLIELFASYHARVGIVYIEQPFKQWKLQNGLRRKGAC
ncbi:hypothetical protein [Dyadobacter sp. 50-39]|uniref:hypothetical protein n=1 Tax=Dyadobacter sp. 50-39 TaxID=1895756 RepID=UPI0025C00DE4|nr:hypothetical protein [Dyadobacter sp. 50-39]